jgi:dihydrolipoamide dehydrogenase
MAEDKTAVAVIGGGPGGYAAAFMAADLGLEVTLIDPEKNPGGVCLYRGCIPSKALLHAARVMEEIRSAAAWGLSVKDVRLDHGKLRDWKNGVVETLTGGLGELAGRRKIRHVRANAAFTGDNTLALDSVDGDRQSLAFDTAIIATGSRPVTLDVFDKGAERLIDSTGALDLAAVPKKLLVVGGGYIGVELGSVYAAIGSSVTLVEMTDGLLPGVDRDLVRILQRRLDAKFESILLNTTVTDAKEQKNGLKVTLASQGADAQTRIFDQVLVAVGRHPNTATIGLDKVSIAPDDAGFIRVDDQQRTSREHIFAVGDVAGQPMLAHKASHEGRCAAEVIAGKRVAFQPSAIPAVVFTDPEIAYAGLSETDAKQNQVDVQVSRFPWAASGRSLTLGRSDGLTKLLVEPATERIIGVGIVGPGAGELIAEGVLAIEMGANAMDLGLTIHPHPTLTETLMEAAEVIHGTATHIYRPKKR